MLESYIIIICICNVYNTTFYGNWFSQHSMGCVVISKKKRSTQQFVNTRTHTHTHAHAHAQTVCGVRYTDKMTARKKSHLFSIAKQLF